MPAHGASGRFLSDRVLRQEPYCEAATCVSVVRARSGLPDSPTGVIEMGINHLWALSSDALVDLA
jgi:hypothetical protein